MKTINIEELTNEEVLSINGGKLSYSLLDAICDIINGFTAWL